MTDRPELRKRSANFVPLSPVSFLARAAEFFGERVAIVHGERRFTYRQFYARARQLAHALTKAGIKRGDTVAILAANTPAMLEAHYAAPMIGAVLNPINIRLDAPLVAFCLEHGEAKLLLADREFHATVAPALEMLGSKRPIVIDIADAETAGAPHFGGVEYEDFIADGDPAFAYAGPEDEWDSICLLYTSGTTGNPKGVMLTHGNFASNIEACLSIVRFDERDLALSFLPLSHVFERMAEYLYLAAGGGIAYAESMETVAANLLEVRPTVVCAVPRVLEKVHARILENVDRQSAVRRRLFAWAVKTGKARLAHLLEGRPAPPLLAARAAIAERLVFSKIKERLGGRVRLLVSGGAPLARELAEFFLGAGVVVLEGYGLTESSPVITLNAPDRIRPGSVGRVIPGVEVRIADDGEILARGPNIMKGYFGDEEATRAVIKDGWLATGDIGSLDADGFLHITDRKKDLIVTSGGKNVAPQPIESALKESRYIANAVLIGDRRKYIGALIVPDIGAIANHLGQEDHGRAADPGQEILRRPEALALIQQEVDRVNEPRPSYEQIRRFVLLDRDLSAEDGELTPTMKVRRRILLQTRREAVEILFKE
jgi:long-chain acyl-CoA synthetase